MAKLTEREIKERDIDWYCLVNGKPTHIASMGGMIPEKFLDREKLRNIQNEVASLAPFANIRLNVAFIQHQVANGYEYLQDQMIRESIEKAIGNNPGFSFLGNYDLPTRLYASTFVEKARRGFRSFVRQEDGDGNEYVLVAEPASPNEYFRQQQLLEKLECEIIDDDKLLIIL